MLPSARTATPTPHLAHTVFRDICEFNGLPLIGDIWREGHSDLGAVSRVSAMVFPGHT